MRLGFLLKKQVFHVHYVPFPLDISLERETVLYGFSFHVTAMSRILGRILCIIHSILLCAEVLL